MRTWIALSTLALAACQFQFGRPLKPGEVRGKLVYEAAGSGAKTPAAGARVRLVGTTLGAVAGEDGAFLFRDVPVGTHTLHAKFALPGSGAEAQLLVPGIAIRARASGAGGTVRNGHDLGTLLLTALSVLSGEVTKNGAPVVGAQVVANGFALAVTGNDGRYALKLPAGDFELVAVYPDAPATRVTQKTAVRVRADQTLNFALSANDAESGSIAGVALYAETEEGLDHSGIRVQLLPSGGGTAVDLLQTNNDGLFAAADIPAGVYTLKATATGFRDAYLAPIAVFTGAQTFAVTLSPEPQDPSTADCDRDGEPDASDADDDGDGTPDGTEASACLCDPSGDRDSNENDICDGSEAIPPAAATPVDSDRPGVLSTVPAANAQNVSPTTEISATFDEPMQGASVTAANAFTLAPTAGGSVQGSVGFAGQTATFVPQAALPPGGYTATIAGTVKDVAGNEMTTPYTWSFSVGATGDDTTPPQITQTSPLDGAKAVARTTPVTALFNEPMDVDTIDATTFMLLAGLEPVPILITSQASGGGTLVTLTPPGGGLNPGTRYTAMVTHGAKDLAGNAVARTSWSFSTAGDVAQISVGELHSCALRDNGTLFCWGWNQYGQVGNGRTAVAELVPVQVGVDADWLQVSAGWDSTCALKTDRTLWCWGRNGVGQLGNGGFANSSVPVKVGADTDWAQVSVGNSFACALKTGGTIHCWGDDFNEQLGNGTASATRTPGAVAGANGNFRFVNAAFSHTCALKTDDTLWCWGDNGSGQLGDGTTNEISTPTQIGNYTFRTVGGGDSTTCALGLDDTLWCWGDNSDGQLGLDNTVAEEHAPRQIGTANDWTALAVGPYHSCGLRGAGELHCWGDNWAGQLGDGTINYPYAVVRAGTDSDWIAVGSGETHTCALKSDKTLFCFGYNAEGEMGNGLGQRLVPSRSDLALDWVSIAAGDNHACAIKNDRSLWCWGAGGQGQTAEPDGNDLSAPKRVGTDNDWLQVSAFLVRSAGIRGAGPGGALYTWGSNTVGIPRAYTPTQFGTDTDWKAAALGAHSCFLKTGGELVCGGGNAFGQVGNGTQVDVPLPYFQHAGTDWAAIMAGNVHTCALKDNGDRYCWGNNADGQLGKGAVGNPPETSPLMIDSGWALLDGDWASTCGIKSDRSLLCWGANLSGGLGTGDAVAKGAPTAVVGGGTWKTVKMGPQHSCGIRQDGTLWCWGSNVGGQVGDGSTTRRESPVEVGGGAGWKDVAAGNGFSCAIRDEGSLWCWGGNSNGELGNGGAWSYSPLLTPMPPAE